jgi:hypothetical protein
MAKFYYVKHVENLPSCSQATQYLNGSKNIVAVVGLKLRPARLFPINQFADTSYLSGFSKFATFAADVCKSFLSADIQLFERNNTEVGNFLLKYNQIDPTDKSTLSKNYLSSTKEH